MMLNQQEKEVLKTLAHAYAQIASLPEQETRRKMWINLNSLHWIVPWY